LSTTDTELTLFGPSLVEAAALATTVLGQAWTAGPAVDLWGPAAPPLPAVTPAWTSDLVGPGGVVGRLSLVIISAEAAADPTRVAAAMVAALPALAGTCAANEVTEPLVQTAGELTPAQPDHRCVAVTLNDADRLAGVLVLTVADQLVTAELPYLEPVPAATQAPRPIAALAEVDMTVSVELGRTRMAVRDLLALHSGAVIQLDRAVTQPVDVFVNGTLIARGEVVVVDEDFGVRITELVTGE
jgi:flagellar motor switch protein FliN/FliY